MSCAIGRVHRRTFRKGHQQQSRGFSSERLVLIANQTHSFAQVASHLAEATADLEKTGWDLLRPFKRRSQDLRPSTQMIIELLVAHSLEAARCALRNKTEDMEAPSVSIHQHSRELSAHMQDMVRRLKKDQNWDKGTSITEQQQAEIEIVLMKRI